MDYDLILLFYNLTNSTLLQPYLKRRMDGKFDKFKNLVSLVNLII
jgi:hypothetical protein